MKIRILVTFVLTFLMACHFQNENSQLADSQSDSPQVTSQTSSKSATTSSINFKSYGTFEEAQAAAKATNKPIFMDVYTDWCYPCKLMDKKVFTDPAAVDFFHQNFINFKLRAQTPENQAIARSYGVRAYPTLVFLDGKGEQLGASIGYIDADKLIDLAKEILEDFE